MPIVEIPAKSTAIEWDYDGKADVLCKPTPALGVDIGDGVILRYDREHQVVVGLTLIGLRARLQTSLGNPPERDTEHATRST
jgi:hypothetical protein